MSLEESLSLLIARWRANPGHVKPACDAADVRRVFEQLGSMATEDVVQMFTRCGGLSEMDGESWEFWSLDRIADENRETPRRGVVFADYLINCSGLLLRPIA